MTLDSVMREIPKDSKAVIYIGTIRAWSGHMKNAKSIYENMHLSGQEKVKNVSYRNGQFVIKVM